MHFQIRSVVLWPRTAPEGPRVLAFQPGMLNVITGASKTGKSAMIPIIDYCLGAERCAIPVGKVRDACSWFGIVIDTPRGQMLLARREPGAQKSTGDMYMVEGATVTVPSSTPAKNTTAEAVKHVLDEMSALTKLDFDVDGTDIGFKGRPSFRDLMAFTFQPQNIIANPDVLFFKADTFEHREKLKTIFPYVLNAVTPEILARQHEAENVRKELIRHERELENLRRVSAQWVAQLHAWAVEARELGLLGSPIAPTATPGAMLGLLRSVMTRPTGALATSEGIGDAVRELVELQKEETEVSSQLTRLRRRYAEMSKLRDAGEGYRSALMVQRDRLGLSKWLKTLSSDAACPICEQALPASNGHLDELVSVLGVIEKESEAIERVPASFEREFVRVEGEIDAATQRLGGVSLRIRSLELRSKDARDSKFRSESVSRFLGRLEQALVTYDAVGLEVGPTAEVAELRSRLDALNKQIAAGSIRMRTERALEKVALLAGQALPHLDAERPSDPITLSPTDLTIKVKGDEREDYLWEIGSGANWLSYHVAVALGLQRFFIESDVSPVPTFLVFDQPSQVYFPRRLAAKKEEEEEDDPKFDDEDARAVEKVFALLALVAKQMAGRLQIIVLDHAGKDVWGGVAGLHLVDEWREGKKLVPPSWPSTR